MDRKSNIDEKKWRRLDIAIECVLVAGAAIIAQMIGTRWFDDSLIATFVVVVIAVCVFTWVKQFILSIIRNSAFLRKPFEKKRN